MLLALAALALLLSEAAPSGRPGQDALHEQAGARLCAAAPQNETGPAQIEAAPSQTEAASFRGEIVGPEDGAQPVVAATAPPAAGTADGSADADGDGDRPAPVLLSLNGSAGTRGEGALELVLRWQGERAAIGLGAEGITGPQTPARQGVIGQVELAFQPATLHAEVRARPLQSGADRISAELGLRLDGSSGDADLTASAVSAQVSGAGIGSGPLPDAEADFTSAGASLEAEAAIGDALWLGANLSAAANQLTWLGRPTAHPWDALGTAVLEWPNQWEATASLRAQSGDATVEVSAGGAEPASPGVLAAEAALKIELAAGPASLAISLGGARQWPSGLWLAEVAFGASLKLGQVDKE